MKRFDKSYFNLIKEFTLTGFKAKDQSSFLGFCWSFLNPLLMSGILFLLFRARIANSDGNGYFIYILTGTIIWNFFVISTSNGLASFIDNPGIVKDCIFPKEVLIFSNIGVLLLQHVFEFIPLFIFMLILRVHFSWFLLFLPVVLLFEVLLVVGFSFFLSTIGVFARDLRHIWNMLTRVGFFLVPVFYEVKTISAQFRIFIEMNPLTQIIIFSRSLVLDQSLPPLKTILFLICTCVTVFYVGYLFFRKFEFFVAENV